MATGSRSPMFTGTKPRIARGDVQLLLLHVGDDDLGASRRQGGKRRHDADRAAADHHADRAGRDVSLVGGLHADGQRLDQRALRHAHVVGQLEGQIGRMDDFRRQATVNRRGRPEAHLRIEIVVAAARSTGTPVRNARLHAHAVARFQTGDVAADRDHHARALVAEHHRRADDEGADVAVLVEMHVAAADADRPHGDLHVVGAWLGRQLECRATAIRRTFSRTKAFIALSSTLRIVLFGPSALLRYPSRTLDRANSWGPPPRVSERATQRACRDIA